MPRPRLRRRICHSPKIFFFKPQGIPLNELEYIELNKEELESLRLTEKLDLEQIQAAKKMNTSQSTFQRILSSARKKIALAIVEGKAIRIEQ